MDLTCYLHEGWAPTIRPATARRAWMDGTPESFAYRCLPLAAANAHGWEILAPLGLRARWNGGARTEDLKVEHAADAPEDLKAVSLFGQGVLTFHIAGIFRTPPGWNLWVSGSPNVQKDGIAPLSGLIETDWSPFTFTMNWRFTRADKWIKFEAGEPIAFFFPVGRGDVEAFTPAFEPLTSNPALAKQFAEWNLSRLAFHEQMKAHPPKEPADKWQKHYYRGMDASGCPGAADHQAKIRAKPFAPLNDSGPARPPRA